MHTLTLNVPSARPPARSLLFELGGIPERELEKLKEEASALGKSSFAFAFYMDRQKEERERGVTIACTTKEFYTSNWHYTIIDAPGASRGRLRACLFLCACFRAHRITRAGLSAAWPTLADLPVP